MEGETDVLPIFGNTQPRRPARVVRRLSLHSPADWHEQGVACELAGDLVAAADRYLVSLALGGPTPQVTFDLAHALADLGRVEEAITRYRQVLQLDPLRGDAWVNLGNLLATGDQYAEAIACFREALRIDPNDAAAHYDLADLLDLTGDQPMARLHYAAFLRAADEPAEQVKYARQRIGMR